MEMLYSQLVLASMVELVLLMVVLPLVLVMVVQVLVLVLVLEVVLMMVVLSLAVVMVMQVMGLLMVILEMVVQFVLHSWLGLLWMIWQVLLLGFRGHLHTDYHLGLRQWEHLEFLGTDDSYGYITHRPLGVNHHLSWECSGMRRS